MACNKEKINKLMELAKLDNVNIDYECAEFLIEYEENFGAYSTVSFTENNEINISYKDENQVDKITSVKDFISDLTQEFVLDCCNWSGDDGYIILLNKLFIATNKDYIAVLDKSYNIVIYKKNKNISLDFVKEKANNKKIIYYVNSEIINNELEKLGLNIEKISIEELYNGDFPFTVYMQDVNEMGVNINIGDWIEGGPYVYKDNIDSYEYILVY